MKPATAAKLEEASHAAARDPGAAGPAGGGRGPPLGWLGRTLALLFPADAAAGEPRARGHAVRVAIASIAAVGAGAGVLLVRQAGDPSWNTLFSGDALHFLPRALSDPLGSLAQLLNGYMQFVPQLIADAVTRLPLRYAASGSPVGRTSCGCPGAAGLVHDKKAEWIWGVLAELEAVCLVTLADRGTRERRTRKRLRGRADWCDLQGFSVS